MESTMRFTSHIGARLAVGLLPLAILQGCEQTVYTTAKTKSNVQEQQLSHVSQFDNGVIVHFDHALTSGAKAIRLEVIDDDIIRVTTITHEDFSSLPHSIMLAKNALQRRSQFTTEQNTKTVKVKTAKVTAQISLHDGRVSFINAQGETVLSEAGRNFAPVTADPITPDEDAYAIRQQWNKNTKEGFFGLGQQQDGHINYAGKNVELTTYNLEIAIPFVVSTRNYGVLWDNNSITQFGDPNKAHPLDEDFILYDAKGNKGGLTAEYYDGDKLLLTRVENDVDYQFLANNSVRERPFPKELANVNEPKVIWKGYIEPTHSGVHEFKMYSSGYAKLSINNNELLNRWRMNWNPWYHNTHIELKKGEKAPIAIEWDSQGGYFNLLHRDPQQKADQFSLSFASETAKAIDYYFVAGENADEVIAGYRELTGKSVMLPKWAYGFWQSRERYQSQKELVDVVKEYRKRQIPLDNIVLDWSYWPENAWGSHDFDKVHFPDPQKMVDDVHNMNANIMISVWPKFYSTTKNYKELADKGYMLTKNVDQEGNVDWIGKGYLNGFYDPYPKESQAIFWRQINEKIKKYGFDAWWLDAAEPDIHSNLSFTKRKEIMSPLAVGSGAEYFNSYAIPHATGVYEGERNAFPNTRSFILTRSGFAGIQRTGSAIWSGDTVPRWSNLKEQIAAGVGAGLAGMPNWTFDIGGFTPENKYRYTSKGFVGNFANLEEEDVANWQELNVRWFQFGAFVPLFRSHGQNPYREIYNLADEGTEVYDTLVYYTKLRYRLMPYIYSEAGKMYHRDGTLMRGLVMDFANDETALTVDDQYMFGPAFMVSPIYEFESRTRSVYLPKGYDWYDFYTGERHSGGKHITASAPLTKMPLFVKAGSIVPIGGEKQFVFDNLAAPITLMIYTGADGDYTLYNDDGKSYGYENGAFSNIAIHYDDTKQQVTINAREGSFPTMIKTRQFNIRFISGENPNAANFNAKADKTITYTGKKVVIKR